MFCTKTSVGYFNYIRFVRQFSQPSNRRLFIMLLVSLLISITWVAIAAGIDSNSSYRITQLYPFKLCWFTRDVIYYFLLIPACVFLAINIIICILVGYHLLKHLRQIAIPDQLNEAIKRCLLIILSSSITQGIAWILGPLLMAVETDVAYALGWIFVIFNGLEGFWAMLIYIIVLSQHRNRKKHMIRSRTSKYKRPYEEIHDITATNSYITNF